MHFEIETMSPELTKYHIKGMPFDAVLHHFTGVDQDDPHDHPFGFQSTILSGGYVERMYTPFSIGGYDVRIMRRCVGESFYVKSSTIHRIIELSEGGCWTIITPGSRERKPGFYRFVGAKILHRFWDETEFKPYKP